LAQAHRLRAHVISGLPNRGLSSPYRPRASVLAMTREASLASSASLASPPQRKHALGAVHRLSEAGQTLGEAQKMAAQAGALAPLTQRAAKAALLDLGRAFEPSDHVLELAATADASLDYAEGRAAFAEKRPPDFCGR
jgi:hypothetical protein